MNTTRKQIEMAMTDFELDKTESGKVKVNIVSVANLVAIIGLLGVAAGTWNTLTSRVDILTTKVDIFQSNAQSRDLTSRDLNQKVETISNRLTAVETILQRVERQLTADSTRRVQ